jgi:hypothetical protein
MADILSEELISLTALAQQLGVDASSVWPWSRRGLAGIQLETLMLGGQRRTSREAANRFFEEVTAARGGTAPRPNSRRESSISRAEREVRDLGI